MKIKRLASTIIGTLQTVLGIASLIFSLSLYYNFLNLQTVLSISSENLYFYLLATLIFGLISLISGLILVKSEV